MNKQKISDLFAASKIIEEEGTDGIRSATEIVGPETATALLITHLRRQLGSMESFPANPDINPKVMQILEQEKLL